MIFLRTSLILLILAPVVQGTSPTARLSAGYSDSATADGLIDKAGEYFRAEEYAKTVKTLEDALKFCPGNAKLHFESAINKQVTGDFYGARTEIRKACEAYPKLAMVFYLSGCARQKSEDYYGGITDLTLAIYINPKVILPFIPRGICRYQVGDFQGAVEDFTVHIESKQPINLANAYLSRGRAHFERNDIRRALADLTDAVALKPTFAQAYRFRCLVYATHGDMANALKDCDSAVANDPEDVGIRSTRIILYADVRDFISAHRDMDSLIKKYPDSASISHLLAILCDAADEINLAIPAYEKAITQAETDSDRETWVYANFNLDLLKRRNHTLGTTEYLKDVFDWTDEWPKPLALFLGGHITAEALERSARNTRDVFIRNRQLCSAYYYIGMTRLLDGSTDEAKTFFEKSLATNQSYMDEYYSSRKQLRNVNTDHVAEIDVRENPAQKGKR
jgi:tetratricopeptide (TPR) repeat protein